MVAPLDFVDTNTINVGTWREHQCTRHDRLHHDAISAFTMLNCNCNFAFGEVKCLLRARRCFEGRTASASTIFSNSTTLDDASCSLDGYLTDQAEFLSMNKVSSFYENFEEYSIISRRQPFHVQEPDHNRIKSSLGKDMASRESVLASTVSTTDFKSRKVIINILSQQRRLNEPSDAIRHPTALQLDAIDISQRWEIDSLILGSVPRFCGLLQKDVYDVDARLFQLSERELACMDPQQSLLLETVSEGLTITGTRGQPKIEHNFTSVFVGASWVDFSQHITSYDQSASFTAHSATGKSISVGAGRLAYTFDFQGPALTVDTACSSSLVALSMASESILIHSTQKAIICGLNVILTPEMNLHFHAAGMLASDGRCKTFDSLANGYVRSEACDALIGHGVDNSRNAIHEHPYFPGEVVGTQFVVEANKLNQDGRSNGLTAPNGLSQFALISSLFNQCLASLNALQIQTHGTGTALGDPIEVFSVVKAIADYDFDGPCAPLRMSAEKSRVGHGEAASGLNSVIRGMMDLKSFIQCGVAHLIQLNAHVLDAMRGGGFQISFPRTGVGRQELLDSSAVVSINSFAFQGTNSMMVISQAQKTDILTVRSRYQKYCAEAHKQITQLTKRQYTLTIMKSEQNVLHLSMRPSTFPVLSELSDHVVSGTAILPGAAHAELARAAAAQVVTFAGFDVGVREMVFSAPLHLHGDHAMQCVVDAEGRIAIGTSIQTRQGRSSFGVRSTGNVTAIVGHAPSAYEKCRLSRHNVIGSTRRIASSGSMLLCRVQMTSGASAPYHVSPRMLDSVFQSSTALASRGSRSRRDHAATQARDVGATHTHSLPSPMVPAALHGTVMQGRQTRCTDMWGSTYLDPAVDADRVSVTSNHRLWTKARLSERCSARIQGLVAKSLPQRATRLQASSARDRTALVRARESSLGRTVYACQWQARGGGVVPAVDLKLRLLDVACEQTRPAGKAGRRLSRPWTSDAHMVAGGSLQMARPRTLCSALASLQGSADCRRNGGFGMHVETTSAMVESSYAHGAASTLGSVGAESSTLWGVAKSTSLESGSHASVSLVDSDPHSICSRYLPANAYVRSNTSAMTLASRQGGTCVSERLFTCESPAGGIGQSPCSLDVDGSRSHVPRDAKCVARCQYMVTGGVGGLGMLAAAWLAQGGMRAARLTGRSGRTLDAPSIAISNSTVSMRIVRADAGCSEDVRNSASRRDERHPADPLVEGLLHSGGALMDAPTPGQCARRVRGVWGGKAAGAWRLMQAETYMSDGLAWCGMFSSVASLMGSPAQCNYSAANASLDTASRMMRCRGIYATSMQWGAWASSGMAAKSSQTLRRTLAGGIGAVSPESGLAALGYILSTDMRRMPVCLHSVVGISPIGWGVDGGVSSSGDSRVGEYSVAAQIASSKSELSTPTADHDTESVMHGRASTTDPTTPRKADLRLLVTNAVNEAVGHAVADDVPLMEEGLDSLSAVELGNALQAATGLALPATLIFDYPTSASISEYVESLLGDVPSQFEAQILPSAEISVHDTARNTVTTIRRKADLRLLVTNAVNEAVGHAVADDVPLMEEGLDSLSAVELGNALQAATGLALPATLIFDYPTSASISEYVESLLGDVPSHSEAKVLPGNETQAPYEDVTPAAPRHPPSDIAGSCDASRAHAVPQSTHLAWSVLVDGHAQDFNARAFVAGLIGKRGVNSQSADGFKARTFVLYFVVAILFLFLCLGLFFLMTALRLRERR
jgi:3-oxoacyl-(acyl-carrier-protein) synthase/acyl carrier protein